MSDGVREAVDPRLLPDPALDWLRRAHDALGVWVAELDPAEEGPRAERIVDAERLSVAQIVAVDRRLERARDAEESGAEAVDGGLLVFRSGGGTAVGLLLPAATEPAQRLQLDDDLRRLLKGVQAKPQLVALAQAGAREVSFESTASIGLRLAYQIERILGQRGMAAEVAVAMAEQEGARLVAVSGRGDQRLLDRMLPPECEFAQAARGAFTDARVSADPLAGVVADRRQLRSAAVLLPIRAEPASVRDGTAAAMVPAAVIGAVAVWQAVDGEWPDDARAEVREALANAAPRLARVAGGSVPRPLAGLDGLTGLHDRRGLEQAIGRGAPGAGALIVIAVDELDVLRTELGMAAADAAIVHVARLLREQIRAGDVPAQAGGDFLLWLPNAGAEIGARVAERVRARIASAPWPWRGRDRRLGISVSVAGRGDGVAPEAFVAQALMEVGRSTGDDRDRVEKVD